MCVEGGVQMTVCLTYHARELYLFNRFLTPLIFCLTSFQPFDKDERSLKFLAVSLSTGNINVSCSVQQPADDNGFWQTCCILITYKIFCQLRAKEFARQQKLIWVIHLTFRFNEYKQTFVRLVALAEVVSLHFPHHRRVLLEREVMDITKCCLFNNAKGLRAPNDFQFLLPCQQYPKNILPRVSPSSSDIG